MSEPVTVASSRIFISYRREDTAGHVLALMPPLRERFGSERIFKDTDSIAPGQDFVRVIESQLQSCSVLLAIIGKDWVSVQDPKLKVRRLENPTDFLRVEVATALKDERVLVIPVLVGKASMPAREELPPDLEPLARRNALELSDIRWDSDVDRLIRAIEHACGESPLAPQAGAPTPTASPPLPLQPEEAATRQRDVDQGETFDLLEDRRDREIAHHVGVAREALEAQDFEAVLEACKKAIWLDPQEPEARTLVRRAQTALNERKISEWLALAQESLAQIAEAPLGRTANEDLASAAERIDQALVLDPDHKAAVRLRQELLRLRKKCEQERDIERHAQGALASARARLDEDDFDSAIQHAGDALALRPDCAEAIDLRSKALAAREHDRREREHTRRAEQTVKRARADFAAGRHGAAVECLERFSPAHEIVSRALDELRRELDAIKEATRQDLLRKALAHVEDAAAALAARRLTDAFGLLQSAREIASRFDAGDRSSEAWISLNGSIEFLAGQGEAARVEANKKVAELEPARLESEVVGQQSPPAEQVAVSKKIRVGPSLSSVRPSHLAAAAIVLLVAALGVWRLLGGPEPSSGGELAAVTGRHAPTAAAEAASGEPRTPASNSPGVAPAGDSPQITQVRPAARTEPVDPAGASAPTAADAGVPRARAQSQRLEQLAARAQRQWQRGQRTEALDMVVEGLTLDPKNAALSGLLDSLLRDAEAAAERSKTDARNAGATSGAASEFSQALQEASEGAKLRDAGRAHGAVRLFWAAAEDFGKAAERSRQAASERAGQAQLVEDEVRQKQRADELAGMKQAAAEEARRHQAVEQAGPNSSHGAPAQPLAPDTHASAEDRVREALRRYEAAFARLSVSDVRGVHPSAPADQLARTFGDLSSYRLDVQVQRVAFFDNGSSATVAGVVTHEFRQKSGRETRASRAQTFVLQRQEQGWVIVLIR